ncbi:integumentary mucin C.1-like [Dendropsophus ebraccatus]|uniref:integumentary mucin C.1-like n=1 Tax=Dendropsophus ebraccatus TaxID=150705 RepID=UPI0038317D2A
MSLQLLLVLVITITSMAVSPDAQCKVPPKERTDCGFSGITKKTCLSKGCCFDSSIRGVIWCYHSSQPTTTETGTHSTTSVPSQSGTTAASHPFDIGLAAEPVTREPSVNATQQTPQNVTTQNATLQTTQNATLQTTQNATLQTTQNATLQTTQNTTLQTTQNTTPHTTHNTALHTTHKTMLQTAGQTTTLNSCGPLRSWSHLTYMCLISIMSVVALSG